MKQLKTQKYNHDHDYENWDNKPPNNDYTDFNVWISIKFRYPIKKAAGRYFYSVDGIFDGIWAIGNHDTPCQHTYRYVIDISNKILYLCEDIIPNTHPHCVLQNIQEIFAGNQFKVKYH